jgi:2-amino-4-hydroxy-6-hydroxymethyldihydropteridine diphosphokinase
MDLLNECQRIESQLGRKRHPDVPRHSSRTIDLDILFYDNLIIANDKLQIPHKRVHLRAFALVPMLELAPNFVHPVIGKNIMDLHNDLPDPEEVYLYGTRFTDF